MNLERHPSIVVDYPRWLRGWSVATAVATFGLIALGTLVTTFHVGMADPLWPTAPWHLLLVERLPSFGWYVEHSHRIVGYFVGVLMLLQTLAIWNYCPDAKRRVAAFLAVSGLVVGTGLGMYLVRQSATRSLDALLNPGFLIAIASALGFLALGVVELQSRTAGRWQRLIVAILCIGVIVQGMLGGLRVYLNELKGPELAIVHGVFAQLVIACAASLVLMTGKNWNSLIELVSDRTFRVLSVAIVALLLVLIVFGGLLRHLQNPLAQRLHPMLAVAAVVLIVWTAARTLTYAEGAGFLRRKAVALVALVGLQAALGIEAWIRTADPASRFQSVTVIDATMRSLHVLTGFGVFASAVLLAARAWKAKLI